MHLMTWLLLSNRKQVRLEDELSKKVAKFEKRLSETDPVSGAPRYGESMTAKVISGKCYRCVYIKLKVAAMNQPAVAPHNRIYVHCRDVSCSFRTLSMRHSSGKSALHASLHCFFRGALVCGLLASPPVGLRLSSPRPDRNQSCSYPPDIRWLPSAPSTKRCSSGWGKWKPTSRPRFPCTNRTKPPVPRRCRRLVTCSSVFPCHILLHAFTPAPVHVIRAARVRKDENSLHYVFCDAAPERRAARQIASVLN